MTPVQDVPWPRPCGQFFPVEHAHGWLFNPSYDTAHTLSANLWRAMVRAPFSSPTKPHQLTLAVHIYIQGIIADPYIL